jgi:hypothetical protein
MRFTIGWLAVTSRAKLGEESAIQNSKDAGRSRTWEKTLQIWNCCTALWFIFLQNYGVYKMKKVNAAALDGVVGDASTTWRGFRGGLQPSASMPRASGPPPFAFGAILGAFSSLWSALTPANPPVGRFAPSSLSLLQTKQGFPGLKLA